MDSRLSFRARTIEKQIDVLKVAEENHLNLDASKETVRANLYIETKGTVGEREAKVEINTEWINFKKALATAKAEYNKQKRLLDLAFKAGDWEYGTYQNENKAIVRQKWT